jgi:hypothetical protein
LILFVGIAEEHLRRKERYNLRYKNLKPDRPVNKQNTPNCTLVLVASKRKVKQERFDCLFQTPLV